MRISTTPIKDSNTYIKFNLDNSFSKINILSLKLKQTELYNSVNADYGTIVGRVYANNGFGVPNARISVFIPLDDNENDSIKEIYPFKTINDLNANGKKYNLLKKNIENTEDKCYQPVGDFPNKREILDNENLEYIHNKYYKYTTVTNNSGDYVLTNIPVGNQIIHVDVDYSDMGVFSLKPSDYIARGVSEKQFISPVKFKSDNNLDNLVQINSIDTSLYVKPFYGQNGDTGINRLDISLNQDIKTSAIITGSIFTDNPKNRVGRNCRPDRKNGRNCQLSTNTGQINILRYNPINQTNELLSLNSVIDEDGIYEIPIELNDNKIITDEFGNLIPSIDNTIGIATTAKIRMQVNMDFNTNYKTMTANYLVPNLYNDFSFDFNTDIKNFFEIKWNNIYSTSSYIPRFQRTRQDSNNNYIGIKRIGDCDNINNFPFNRINSNFNPLYTILCVVIRVIASVINAINSIPLVGNISLPCDGCENGECEDANNWRDCQLSNIAELFDNIEYEFYNDWIIGGLYMPQFRYKIKFKNNGKVFERFCDFDCREIENLDNDDEHYRNKCNTTFIVDSDNFNTAPNYFSENESIQRIGSPYGRGIIIEKNNQLFYAARNDLNSNGDITSELNLTSNNPNENTKKHLLFATNFVPLGSFKKLNYFNEPVFFNLLETTTYNENTINGCLLNYNNCVRPNNININNIYKFCQYGSEILDEEDLLTINNCQINFTNSDIRKYLCENNSKYGESYVYNITTDSVIADIAGNQIDKLEDECSCSNQTNILMKNNPYYFYFGVNNGKSAYDKIISRYFITC